MELVPGAQAIPQIYAQNVNAGLSVREVTRRHWTDHRMSRLADSMHTAGLPGIDNYIGTNMIRENIYHCTETAEQR
jgi:hypothetical protein